MLLLRKGVILITDIFILIVIVLLLFTTVISDPYGLGCLFSFLFLFFFNLYALIIYLIFKKINKKHYLIEILYTILILSPFIILFL